jgi:hypothetical protein
MKMMTNLICSLGAPSVILLVAVTFGALAAFAGSPWQPFDDLLNRTGKQVSAFLDEFSEVKCTEMVSQVKVGKTGKIEDKQESTFDYLVIMTNAGGAMNLSESRLAERQSKHDQAKPLLVTNGFATFFLIFHPYYQGSFQFSLLDDELLDGKRFNRVHFEHIKGTRSPTALVLRGKEFPLDLSGNAWIDPESGNIAKISAGLDAGLDDLGLKVLRSEVQYSPVTFRGVAQNYWFPSLATIEVETPRQHWRNTHRFTDYKQFSVSTEEAVSTKP